MFDARSGAKKPPVALVFDPQDALHMEFIASVANLRAALFHLPRCDDVAYMARLASSATVARFQAADGVKIAATEEEAKAENERAAQSGAASGLELDVMCESIIRLAACCCMHLRQVLPHRPATQARLAGLIVSRVESSSLGAGLGLCRSDEWVWSIHRPCHADMKEGTRLGVCNVHTLTSRQMSGDRGRGVSLDL
jgi:hypothetical protein